MRRFHLSVDDVFGAVMQLSDWGLPVAGQPMLAFLDRLHRETGAVTDLYLFAAAVLADGRRRRLDELTEAAAATLGAAPAFRWGPHARDYATAPHAQPAEEARADFAALLAGIGRIAPPARRSDWVRLHYFSELYELADLWSAHGITALMTTDRPAVAWRLPAAARAELAASGQTRHAGCGFVASHLRVEFFAAEAADPARFCARMDAALDRHGFVSVFTHEAELDDPRIRRLLAAACDHAARRGLI
jgi:hypothetical protein